MFKEFLRFAQTSAEECVDKAAQWASDISMMESRGPGDLENAWCRIERQYGIPASLFWSLRYRRPKQIAAHHFARLYAVRETIAERRLRSFNDEGACHGKMELDDGA